MIRWALHKAITKFERGWNYDASYMHEMIDASPRAAWLFSRVTALGQFRRDIPVEAGVPPALPPCATRIADRARSSLSRWRSALA